MFLVFELWSKTRKVPSSVNIFIFRAYFKILYKPLIRFCHFNYVKTKPWLFPSSLTIDVLVYMYHLAKTRGQALIIVNIFISRT
ncbi:hypothetical protein B9Z55_023834 [Caenorhabditis nigoni]|uniref:Uncharacterized protein n=1 Tax=Caenorhabditis nigoni TaxID=1611254 RepID=A0A2G5SS30_9PELO|nr:hypothetical protein B9Z55_023834 [Caenorhabditis nigoni]